MLKNRERVSYNMHASKKNNHCNSLFEQRSVRMKMNFMPILLHRWSCDCWSAASILSDVPLSTV